MTISVNSVSRPQIETAKLRDITRTFIKDISVPHEKFNKAKALNSCTDFLHCRNISPTRTSIAAAESTTKYLNATPCDIRRNLSQLKDCPNIKNMIMNNVANTKRLYPKTAELRDRLINEKRVVFDKVQPALKGLEKLLLKIKVTL